MRCCSYSDRNIAQTKTDGKGKCDDMPVKSLKTISLILKIIARGSTVVLFSTFAFIFIYHISNNTENFTISTQYFLHGVIAFSFSAILLAFPLTDVVEGKIKKQNAESVTQTWQK